MAKSKKQTEFEKIDSLASTYKKFTDEQLMIFVNSPYKSSQKKYRRAAVKNELKRRGINIH